MAVQGRRPRGGARRGISQGGTSQDILSEGILGRAIAAHRALRDREAWRRERERAGAPPPAEAPPRPRGGPEAAARAQFAAALTRLVFGRFYGAPPLTDGTRPRPAGEPARRRPGARPEEPPAGR